jgi:hypothetical protein
LDQSGGFHIILDRISTVSKSEGTRVSVGARAYVNVAFRLFGFVVTESENNPEELLYLMIEEESDYLRI